MRKRSKYRPKFVAADPVSYALSLVAPVISNPSWLVSVRLKNHGAVASMMDGAGNQRQMRDITAMFNMCRMLTLMGKQAELGVCVIPQAENAIADIQARAVQLGRYVLTGPEITTLKQLLEAHDAQLDTCTQGDIDRAIARTARERLGGKSRTLKSSKTLQAQL